MLVSVSVSDASVGVMPVMWLTNSDTRYNEYAICMPSNIYIDVYIYCISNQVGARATLASWQLQ